MLLGLLLGNTSLRFGILDGERIVLSGRIEWQEMAARGAEIARAAERHGAREAVAGSVRDDLASRLEGWLPEGMSRVVYARRDFPLPIENRYERPDEVGTDRLLNALAARKRHPGAPVIVVDFGTAVSVSVVAADGAFAGGLIAAGGATLVRSLAASTPRLPPARLGPPRTFVARSTDEALRGGLYWQVAGGVRAMVQGIRQELPGAPARVIATGGEAALFAPAVPEIEELAPDLTLEGLGVAALSRRGGAAKGPPGR